MRNSENRQMGIELDKLPKTALSLYVIVLGGLQQRNTSMKTRSILITAFSAFLAMPVTSNMAFAFCGVIQESDSARTAERASQKAHNAVRYKINKLRSQYGSKLKAERASLACLGGAVAIDANGNQIVGKPSCTATVAFCVNP